VARKVALMREGMGPLDGIQPGDLELYFAACARVAGVAWTAPSRPAEARVEERAKAIGKILDRKVKKTLAGMAARFAAIGDLGPWRRAHLDAAARIGLVVAGDLGAALGELKLTIGSAEGGALARFAVSEEMAALRRELGLRP
jgi:hypothetical protein